MEFPNFLDMSLWMRLRQKRDFWVKLPCGEMERVGHSVCYMTMGTPKEKTELVQETHIFGGTVKIQEWFKNLKCPQLIRARIVRKGVAFLGLPEEKVRVIVNCKPDCEEELYSISLLLPEKDGKNAVTECTKEGRILY